MPTFASHPHALMLVAATACWGVGTVLSKQVLDRGVAPLTLLVIELAASCALLAAGTAAQRVPWRRSPNLLTLAALGVLNPGLAYALGLVGLVSISASMSVLLWGVEPVLILLLALVFLRERIRLGTGVAMTLALLGVLLVVFRPGASGDSTGIVLTVAAVAACACYTVLTRKFLLDDSSVLVVLTQQVTALAFAVILAGTAVSLGAAEAGLPGDFGTWVLAATSGVVYYGLAFWFFVAGLRGVHASVAGAFLPLIPVFGLAGGYVTGDRLEARQLIGALIVVVAVAAVTVFNRNPRRGESAI